MSGTIFISDDDAWPVSGWLYRWVVEDLKNTPISAEGKDELDMALAMQTLDLRDFSTADRALLSAALGAPLLEHFQIGLEPGYDPASAIQTLRELGALAARAAT